jgi:hypothetical protein
MSRDTISVTTEALRIHPEFSNYLRDYEYLARRLLKHVNEGV